jgi:MFS family permease
VTDSPAPAMGNRAVLRLPEFRKLFVAQAISDVGDGMTFTALLLLVNNLTHSPAALAVLSIAVAVPSMVGGIIAGAYADRLDRRRIMIVSDTVRALLVLGFVVVGTVERLPILYLVAFAQASIGTFFSPARGALIPRVVPREGLMAANGLGQISRTVGNLLGTALIGLLIASTGAYWPAFVLDAATFVASVVIVLAVDPALGRVVPAADGRHTGGVGASAIEGLRLIGRSPTLVATILGLSIAGLGLGAVNLLFVPFVINTLQASAAWIGPIEGAQTLSLILAGGLVAVLARRMSAQSMVAGGLAGVGVLIAVLYAAPSVYFLLLIAFGFGWFVTPLQAATQTIVQSVTSDATRGRVIGALQASMSTTQIVSIALGGVFASVIGIRSLFLIAGLVCLAAAGITALLFRADRGRIAAPSSEAVEDVEPAQGSDGGQPRTASPPAAG